MKNRVIQLIVALPAALFIATGLRWLITPTLVAPEFGLEAGTGLGLSTQVGDLSAFFLTLGGSIVVALVSGQQRWYYPAIALLLMAALGRTIAWLFHDAVLTPFIGLELAVAALLWWASRRNTGSVSQ